MVVYASEGLFVQYNFRYKVGTEANSVNFHLATVLAIIMYIIAVYRKSYFFFQLPLLKGHLVNHHYMSYITRMFLNRCLKKKMKRSEI